MAGAYDRLKKLIEQEEEQKGKRRSGSYGETPANRGSRAAHGELTESGSTEYRGKRYARPAEGAQEKKTAPWERAVSKAMTAAGTQKRRQEEAARETGGLTPALEARYQQANGVNRAPSAYQTYMMQQVNAQPRQAETRSTDELRRDMNRQNRLAAGTNRMAADMGNRMTQDQSLIYNPTYTSNLRTMGQTMEAQQEKANRATRLYQTLSAQRREQEERAKVLEMIMMRNPDFLKNSQGNVAIADGGMAVSTGSNSKARLYRDIYYRGTSGIDGKGVTDSAARNVTDEEAAVFFYIWNTQTPEAAERFYKDYLENRAGERQMGKIQTQAQAYGEYDPLGASVLSVGTNVLSGVGLVDMAWQNIARSVGITDKNKPLNYYSPAQSFSLKTDALRQGASNFLEQAAVDEIKRIHPNVKHPENYAKVAGFLYQTGMSMADSSVAVALNLMGIPEPLTLAMMGSAAGTRAIREARERGATDGQKYSTCSGGSWSRASAKRRR